MELQDAILKAIDSLTKNRIERLQLDKTITGSIIKCNNALTREYKVSYNGGSLTAYAKEGETYTNGNSVYVLVPENDFTKQKIILGLSSAQSDDNNISFVSSALSDYNIIGKNIINDVNEIQPIGLHSYLKEEYKLLYKHGIESSKDNPFFEINANELANNIKESEAILIEASFKTRLPKEHMISLKGIYGLQFVLAYKNKDKRQKNKYKEFLPDKSLLQKPAQKVEKDKEEEKPQENVSNPSRLEIIKNDFLYIFNYIPENQREEEINTLIFNLAMSMRAAMAPQTIQDEFIGKLQSIKNIEQVNSTFAELEATKAEDVRYISYNIDSNTMTGNPLRFTQWSDQYQIFPIDVENFLYIDSIMFYEKDFVKTSNYEEAQDSIGRWGADIFLKDIEFYGLRKISSEKDGFRLKLSMPDGNTLYTTNNQNSVTAEATVLENGSNLSDNTTFYWFKEDNRVTTTSENYQYYGGAGWAHLKDKGKNYKCALHGNENMAYENKYLCTAVYKEQVVLKEYFTVYNEAVKRDLSIHSTLGTRFSFDRGAPTLTCLIDGKEVNFEEDKVNSHSDDKFRFVWSKESIGYTTIFSETKEELQKRYDELFKQMLEDQKNPNKPDSEKITFKDLTALRDKIASLANVSWDKNKLTYPISAIDSQAKFKCSVYLRDVDPAPNEDVTTVEYNIGSAEITLQNESIALPEDYYLVIENGDQVFQYSESGVAPNDERYPEPLQVLPLSCHFFDPAGLEVNKETYELKWQVPLTDTMIVTPRDSMVLNHATNLKEWYTNKIYNLEIAKDYNYQALNNQLTAIVTYQGQEYTQKTNLFFTKIGENGTNGTDIVAKIQPLLKMPKGRADDALAIIDVDYDVNGAPLLDENGMQILPKYNDANNTPLTEKAFDFRLFQRNEEIPKARYNANWGISGVKNQSQNMEIPSAGVVSWTHADPNGSKKYRYQIFKVEAKYENNSYYAHYGLPVIDYYNDKARDFEVRINNTTLLKSITYNADGRNPLYNKNQGVELHCYQNGEEITTPWIVWSAEGGFDEHNLSNPKHASFKLSKQQNSSSEKASDFLEPSIIYEGMELGPSHKNPAAEEKPQEKAGLAEIGLEYLNKIYIVPNDVYSGEYTNNIVHAKLYKNRDTYDSGRGNPIVEVYIPIYMSLNTYGLKSLNAWDGNHIEINEDENYILAPQIGAGVKDNANKFTGIVMGQAQTFDKTTNGIVKPSSTVGLLGYSKGLQSIVLNAADGSAIFGLPEYEGEENNNFAEGRVKIIPGGVSEIGSWKIGNDALFNIQGLTEKNFMSNPLTGARQIKIESLPPYKDKGKLYHLSVPHDKSGIILGANPSYISVKGAKIVNNSGIDFTNANTVVQLGDSFELQLDPSDNSIFTVYRHTNAPEEAYVVDKNNNIILLSDLDKEDPTIYSKPIYQDRQNQTIVGWTPLVEAKSGCIIAINGSGKESSAPYWIFRALNKWKINTPFYFDRNVESVEYNWRREPKVGINSQGRFYTNALKDNTTALTIGNIGAFGMSAQSQQYVGASFEIGTGNTNNTLFKMFTDAHDVNKEDGTLYLSGATSANDDYQRPLQMHFNSIAMYTTKRPNVNQKTTSTKFILDESKGLFLGNIKDEGNGNYFKMDLSKTENSITELITSNKLNIAFPNDKSMNLSGGNLKLSLSPKGDLEINQTDNATFVHTLNSKHTTLNKGDYRLDINGTTSASSFKMVVNSSSLYFGDKLNERGLEMGTGANGNISSKLHIFSKDGMNIDTSNGPMNITVKGTASGQGIIIKSQYSDDIASSYLKLVGGIDGKSGFSLVSRLGTITTIHESNQPGVRSTVNLHAPDFYLKSDIGLPEWVTTAEWIDRASVKALIRDLYIKIQKLQNAYNVHTHTFEELKTVSDSKIATFGKGTVVGEAKYSRGTGAEAEKVHTMDIKLGDNFTLKEPKLVAVTGADSLQQTVNFNKTVTFNGTSSKPNAQV